MSNTPEGKVKARISKLLRSRTKVYYIMPVTGGFGAATLDYVGAANGHPFAVEAKAPGEKPTVRQEATAQNMRRAGITVFVVDGGESLTVLQNWLEEVQA